MFMRVSTRSTAYNAALGKKWDFYMSFVLSDIGCLVCCSFFRKSSKTGYDAYPRDRVDFGLARSPE